MFYSFYITSSQASENLALLRKGFTDKVITWCSHEELTNWDVSAETYKFLLAAHLMKVFI